MEIINDAHVLVSFSLVSSAFLSGFFPDVVVEDKN
jgi:hypothetical protein